MKRARLAVAAVAVSLFLAVGYAQSPASSTPTAPPPSNSDPASSNVTAKGVGRDMLNAVMQPVQQQLGQSLQAGIGLLFNRLFSALGSSSSAPAASPTPADATSTSAAAYQAPAAPASNPNGQPASDPAAAAAPSAPPVVPSVVYALDQVDPTTFTTITTIDLSHGAPVLHTGDVFAIRYSTNLPGQVRIDNIDSAGATNPLGTYTVVAGRDNRIPVTKGIQLTGVTGTEQFKMYFYPCAAADSGGGSGNGAGLPACSAAANPKLLMASKRLVVAKSATNLESPDPTIAVAATANYRPNDVTENDFTLQHMPRQ